MITQVPSNIIFVTIRISQFGQRLDHALSVLLSNHSRSQIKKWIISKQVKVDNRIITVPKKKVIGGESVEIHDINDLNHTLFPQNIPIHVIYEDDDICVINKKNNMIVHPGAGNYSGTILNALLYRYPSIIQVTRGGIVQRLDKDTTGLMVVAKNIFAYNNLLTLFKERKVIREYEAVVCGNFNCDMGVINKPIRRHVMHRTCMAIHARGKTAITHYFIIEKLGMYSRLRLRLETGRTHQIRVHMAYIDHPLVGDQKYGKVITCINDDMSNELKDYLHCFKRQALHACVLQLYHPSTQEEMKWSIPLPEDMIRLINILRKF